MSEENAHRAGGEYPTRRPGHELCAARERAGISREEIARILHLPQEQVDALEADQFSRLPPPAYVRGYLRAYAREVGMDADQVVADYDAICGETHDPELVIHPGQPDPGSGRGPVLALLVVVAVALVGAVAWWLQQPALSPIATQEGVATEEAVEAVSGEPTATGAEEPAANEPTEPEAPAAGPEPSSEPTIPEAPEPGATGESAAPGTAAGSGGTVSGVVADAGTDTGETAATVVEPAPAGGRGEAEPASAAGGTGEAEPATADSGGTAADTGVEPGAESMVATGDRPTATSRAELVPTEAAAQGPDTLVVDVDGRSWLEVFDARGRQLAYTLYSGDEPVELNGWAPFEVFLGNSPDVTLRFEGSEIDHSAFVRSDNTARFVVDAGGARRR